MSDLDLDAQVALVCETPVARRSELIDLSLQSEALIAQLPPAELCFTAKAVGLHDAGIPHVEIEARDELLLGGVLE
jgi:hypothetical protein